ncbi:MAG: Gldg family protein [Limisphaerales bacterium]
MAANSPNPASFTPGRRWSAAVNVGLGLLAALAIVVAVNFISRNYFFQRWFVSERAGTRLSPQTLALLKTITNDVRITLYYDKDDAMYPTISALLNEYRLANPRLTVETVDYNKDPVAAQKLTARHQLDPRNLKDLVIFEAGDRVKMVPGAALTDYTLEPVINEREREFRKKPVAFKGELMFTSLLLAVNQAEPLRAAYLTGHGQPALDNNDDLTGYGAFRSLVMQNYIQLEPVSLLGTNQLPPDCRLLIIAAPATPLEEVELAKIARYLEEGGRLLALFHYATAGKPTGLEALLATWGVDVTPFLVQDEPKSIRGQDIIIERFNRHPVTGPLLDSRIHVLLPRWIAARETGTTAADAPRVDELALTSEAATLLGTNAPPRAYPVAAAIEKGAVKGVANERGTTRILVVGDSLLFGNQMLASAANRDFANYALNWLTDRTQLVGGLGPKPVTEFRLVLSRDEFARARWLLLAGLPGAVLLLGAIVWFRRRQ